MRLSAYFITGRDMDWLPQLQNQNPDVAKLASDVAATYHPSLDELDVGIPTLHYQEGHLPQSQIEGANDRYVSVHEYLQGFVRFILQDPVRRDFLADSLFTNIQFMDLHAQLPFLMTDGNPKTTYDAKQRTALLSRIATIKARIDYSDSTNSQALQDALLVDLAHNPLPFDKTKLEHHTLPAWDVWGGNLTACIGLENGHVAAFAYALGSQVDLQAYELFDPTGARLDHGFASAELLGKSGLVYIDPASHLIKDTPYFTADRLPSSVRAVPLSELEYIAFNAVNVLREDRQSAHPQMTAAEKQAHIEMALFWAPHSVFVLLEAWTVYGELGEEQKSSDFLQQALKYYPDMLKK